LFDRIYKFWLLTISMEFNLRAEDGSLAISWREISGCYESNPTLRTSGYDIRLVHIPPRKSYQLAAEKNIVAAVHGEISEPKLKAVESSICIGGSLKAGESDVVLAVVVPYGELSEDFTKPPALEGLKLEWVAAGKRWKALEGRNMHFTYPVIVIDSPELEKLIRVKLWQAGSNVEMGIHNHAGEDGLEEIHFQLAGSGEMQRFSNSNEDSLAEVVPQYPGQSHKPFWGRDGKYPYHQYQAGGKGTLFGVVEKVLRK